MPGPTVGIVTGYVPIKGHPRSASEYGALGEIFTQIHGDFLIHPFYETVGEMWLMKHIVSLPYAVSHSVADNPQKNSLAYHCVNHQKFGWLLKAKMLHPSLKTLIWLDYGIGHVPGVTADVISEFITKVHHGDFAIPGCWPKEGLVINDYFPCWRFCGGLMVVPAARVYPFYKAVKNAAAASIRRTHNVAWEVNTLARAEPKLPGLRWYAADHNQTMFTNYGEKPCPNDASLPGSEAPSDAMSTRTSCTTPTGTSLE